MPYSEHFETVIKKQNSWFQFDILELLRYKDLIAMFVKRNIAIYYKQTVLGPAWILLNPLLSSVLFTFIFGQMAGMSTDGTPQFLFYFIGSSLWGLFSSSINGASNTFIANAGMFGKIYFPRLTVPIANSLSSFFNFFIQMILFAGFYLFYYFTGSPIKLTLWAFAIPLLLLQLMILGVGCGIVVAALTTKYRDLVIAVTFGVQLWMYITPIVYPVSSLGGLTRKIVLLNPVTPIIEILRYGLLGVGEVSLMYWGISIVFTIMIVIFGIALFGRIEKSFVDTV